MSKFVHAGRSLLDLLIILAIGLVPVASGLLVMSYQLDRKLEENSRVSLNEAIFAIDRSLDGIHTAALGALPLASEHCDAVRQKLSGYVSRDQRLHSMMLIRDGQEFCSSLSTSDNLPRLVDTASPVKLLFNAPSMPNSALVRYQLTKSNPGVIVTAYGTVLRNELSGFQDGLVLVLKFGEQYIWSAGDSRDPQPPSQSEHFNRAVSKKYGYTVQGGYPQGFRKEELRQSAVQVLPSLALVGLVTAVIVYWGIFRNRSKGKRNADGR
ncbi:CSS-motif domain-containing protein [Pseudomonas entomophila]|uniref:CSS-motif domain-containing protein n=1 Tax=Pseudomonas entomophila TaxID=312306 RepID=UPI0023D8C59B|nr:CSS-motif domain-containing protein [Pseudomonas entomophila]MDF0732998.1 CSS-motif domain-containing protein [Pseudomonas entomophila]